MNGWLNRNATQCTDERRIGAPVGIVAARCIEPVDIARKDNVPEDRTNTSSGEMHEDEKNTLHVYRSSRKTHQSLVITE